MSESDLSRRDFLKRGVGAVVVGGAAIAGGVLLHDKTGTAGLADASANIVRLGNYFADIDFPASSPRLSIAAGNDKQIDRLVRAAIGGLDPQRGIQRFIARGDIVLLKPNVGFDRAPYLGATTHPEVIRSLVRLCKDAGAAKVLITDNPIESPEACFAKSGIGQVAKEEGAAVVLPTRGQFNLLAVRDREPDPRKDEAIGHWPTLTGPLLAATKVIGAAPVKDHNLAGASMTMKNWYGLLGGRRNQFHQAIHSVISDLGMMVSPTLIVADATRVMMRNGPTGGRLSDVKPGGAIGRPTVVASVDPVACDAWCYERLLGRDPAQLAYLDLAARKIHARIEAGERRFGEGDWHTYERQNKIITVDVQTG